MKTQPCDYPASPDSPPNTSPRPSLLGLAILALIIGGLICYITSCAQLGNIPISVSYQDENGETFTVTKGATVLPQK